MSRLYKMQGRVFRLDPEIYSLAKLNGLTRNDIEREYSFMQRVTPGIRIVNYNHAVYSAYMKKKGKPLW